MSERVNSRWRVLLRGTRSLLSIAVVTLPLYTVVFVVLQVQLERRQVPVGFVVMASWAVLLVLWAAVAWLNGARFRFGMRGLLVGSTIAAVLAALATYAVPFFRTRQAIAVIARAGGSYQTEPCGPAWLRRLFGDEYFRAVVHVDLMGRRFTDDDMAHIAALSELKNLWLGRTAVTDEGLRHISQLTQLEHLDLPSLGDGRVTDASFAYLGRLTKLRHLDASDTLVRDEGLAHLSGLRALEKLELENTEITNEGLRHLRKLSNLRSLSLSGTKVTRAAEDRLLAELSNSARIEQ